MTRLQTTRHYEETARIDADPRAVFAFLDDHSRLSAHMEKPSWRTAGSTMDLELDEARGKSVGSHIRMRGRVLGVRLWLDEIVSRRDPPRVKEWHTTGTPRLLVVGHYRLRAEIEPNARGSILHVRIDYGLPRTNAWIGRMFGPAYARWCVRQMTGDVSKHFARTTTAWPAGTDPRERPPMTEQS